MLASTLGCLFAITVVSFVLFREYKRKVSNSENSVRKVEFLLLVSNTVLTFTILLVASIVVKDYTTFVVMSNVVGLSLIVTLIFGKSFLNKTLTLIKQ